MFAKLQEIHRRFYPHNYWRKKTPTLIQMEDLECGAACLGIILSYYKKYVPLEELRVITGVSSSGSNAKNIVKAARYYKLEAQGYRYELEDLKHEDLPAILHWGFNHFVVLEGFYQGQYFINDPANGHKTISEKEFSAKFTGIVLVFKPQSDFEMSQYRPSIIKSLQKRAKGLDNLLFFVFLLAVFLLIPGLITPIFIRIFVDDILLGGNQDWLIPLLGGMSVTLLLQGFLTYLRQSALTKLEAKLAISSSGKYMWHVLRLPTQFYYQRKAGEIANRVTFNDYVANFLTGQLTTAFFDILVAGFFLILMLQYSITLTFIVLLSAALNFLILQKAAQKREDSDIFLLQEKGKLISNTLFGVQMIETIKANGQEGAFFAKWAGYQAKTINYEQEFNRITQILYAVPQLISSLTMAFVLIIGARLVIVGSLSIGMVVAFQGLMMSFMEPIRRMVGLGADIHAIGSNLDRLDDVENHPLDYSFQTESTAKTDILKAKLNGAVQLKNVTFGYNKMAPPLIKDFNLSIKPGSRVAILGASGSGKSTVGKLVAGLYQPWEGEIRFDGVKVDQIPRGVIKSSLAIVDQEIHLLEGTIRENLVMWDDSIPDKNIIQGIKDAKIAERIAQQSSGYDGKVGENAHNFSGGEKQRLEIARALTNNPTILILDEATSALDTITEKMIDENIRKRGCTCLIIAHRLSTIRDCEEIIVLDQGAIIQRGTHEELIQDEAGLYKQLITAE